MKITVSHRTSNNEEGGRRFRLLVCATLLCVLSACTTSGGKLGEPSTLHAAEVVQVLNRTDILGSHGIHESLTNGGVSDSAIVDGSVVIVRTSCCGPPMTGNAHGVLNLQGVTLHVGDIIEYVIPGGSSVNTLTRVIQKTGEANSQCWWEPRNEALWRRVMYCSWMPEQGWVQQTGHLIIGWYKPNGNGNN
jgi:hypothetical protein